MNRRTFLGLPIGLLFSPTDLTIIERARVLRAADRYLREAPVTITASSSPRSAGGPHDYFSEGDYWWPDPDNPAGPYIQRDGMSNPGNFNDHRLALIGLSLRVPALTAAWMVTRDRRYASHAVRHLHAWFLDTATRMNPHLRYAQAIKGRVTGRGTGIIDTLHLVEVARAISVLEGANVMSRQERADVKEWFAKYLTWMTTHEYGVQERDTKNNHATCWVMQVAEFARLTDNDRLTSFCRTRYKTVLLPDQMAPDGSFPLEIARTKPYGYSLFNLDAMAMICEILATPQDNLWAFQLHDERGMAKAMEFMFPYMADKARWPYKPDVMYFDQWPVRQPSLLFAGLALQRAEYLDLWRRLDADPTVDEVIRNFVVRQPLVWMSGSDATPVDK
jgi:hypothetical protein